VVNEHYGRDRIVFKGRVRGRKTLAPGRYAVIVTAALSGAQPSVSKRLSFTITSR
jgi:hypothetical protein